MPPAVLTCVQDPSPMSFALLAAHGWEEVFFQAQNGGNNPLDFNLDFARNQGMKRASVWGVTYAPDDRGNNPRGLSFYEQNLILGKQAVKLKADTAMIDAEYCAKFTRKTQGLLPCIKALRDAGYQGKVHLCPLGAPFDPLVNDFEVDVQSFLDTGGDIYPQAYMHDHEEYEPELCVTYWTRDVVGVPRDRLNIMVSFSAGDTSKIRWGGNRWLPHLQKVEDSVGRSISSFMAEYMTEADLVGLDALTLQTAGPTAIEVRVETHYRHWAYENHPERDKPGYQPGSRISEGRRVVDCNDKQWARVGPILRRALDAAGVPKS
jgi:hypothetical protein